MFGIVGFLGGYFDKTFSKESRITIMLMVMASTILHEMGLYLLNIMIASAAFEIWNFIKIILIETLFNAILTIILYPFIQFAGYYMEDTFKGSKILTKYF